MVTPQAPSSPLLPLPPSPPSHNSAPSLKPHPTTRPLLRHPPTLHRPPRLPFNPHPQTLLTPMKTIIPLQMQFLKPIITAFIEAECWRLRIRTACSATALPAALPTSTPAVLAVIAGLSGLSSGIARQTMNAIPAQIVEIREAGLHGGHPGGGEGVGWRRGGGGGEEAGCGWGGPG